MMSLRLTLPRDHLPRVGLETTSPRRAPLLRAYPAALPEILRYEEKCPRKLETWQKPVQPRDIEHKLDTDLWKDHRVVL